MIEPAARTGFAEANRGLRVAASVSGLVGTAALVVYFAAPAFLGWPYAGAPAVELAAYAAAHSSLFYAGAWLQVTGTLLTVLMFIAIVRLADASVTVAGLVTIVASAVLLATVVVEATFLVAVPTAATSGDLATVATTFALANGAFVRVFPMAPASATLIALGVVLVRSHVVGRWIAALAIGLGAAFEVAGVLAIFFAAGLVFAIVLSIVQAAWSLAVAVALAQPGADPAARHG